MLSKTSSTPLIGILKTSFSQKKYFYKLQNRCFSSHRSLLKIKSSITDFPPLSQPLPNLSKPIYSNTPKEHQKTEITTLPNGLKIATENRPGKFFTVGVLVDSGPRFEVAYPSGIAHFLEKLAFNSTKNYENKDHIMQTLEKHGGICDCQASRDTFIYAASAELLGLDVVLKLLGDVVLRPLITEEELNTARQTIQFELESLSTRPEQEPLLIDMIHAAAYRDNTVGLPKICPTINVKKIDKKILFTYLKNHNIPKRMVVAGVGIDHNDLVTAVEKYFVKEKPIWDEDVSLTIAERGANIIDESVAQYTGGYVLEECNIPIHAGTSNLPELSHVVIGLEGCSHQDNDFITICVLNMMMGGGGSFSSGGPGKGMYTRLYTNVLNRYHWLYSATAYNHAYSDTGLFCIHASSTPDYVKEMVQVIVKELVAMTGSITENELARAKKQLQSMLLMNLEQRPVVFEDIGRQVLATGSRKRPEYFIEEIDKVTRDDVQRVSRRLLKSPPSVAARGDVKHVPTIAEIQAGLLDSQGKMPGSRSRLSLFR